MTSPASSERAVRTIHLGDERITALLDRMDALATTSGTPRAQFYPYRHKALVVHMQQPGSTITVPYLVPTRHISEKELAFLHGGFVHPGTRCVVQLLTTCGTCDNVAGRVTSCQYVDGNIHEVSVQFDHPVDPSAFCRSAVHTRVLLAEDDPATTRLAKFHLEQLNARVDHAENGEVAVEKAMENVYDLILMDIEMPVMDGLEATRELRRRGYSGTIVAVTAMTRPQDRQRCLEAGCDRYIAKPYKRADLDDLIQAMRQQPLISSMHDDPAMSEMIHAFVQELPAKVRCIQEAIARQDIQTLESLTRALKGEGSGYGFEVITDAAAKIETALINGASMDKVQEHVKALVKLCTQARSSAGDAQPPASDESDDDKDV